MKKLSIKAKVTLWYTGLMVVLLALMLVFLFSFSDRLLTRRLQNTLVDVVTDAVNKAEFDHDELEAKEIDFYRDGVSIFIYDIDGRLMAPQINQGIKISAVLEDRTIKTVKGSAGEQWLVHDLIAQKDGITFWVRGVVSLSGTTGTLNSMATTALIVAPLVILVAAIGGWQVTKQSFKNVKNMAETAKAISSGNDLSLRVQTRGATDELSTLVDTLNAMLERLQASFENERQFASDASHELRTPAAIILSECEFALSEKVRDKEREEALRAILKQAQKMSALINQLLLMARAQSGKFEPHWEKICLSELCEIMAQEMEVVADEKEITIETHLEPNIVIQADEMLMGRLLENLIHNAIVYNHKGGHVVLSLKKDKETAVLQVEDTGIGIRREDQDKIWRRFYRVDTSRSGEGTGLGLAMVKWIAKIHDAKVNVESEWQKGSKFTVIVPREHQ